MTMQDQNEVNGQSETAPEKVAKAPKPLGEFEIELTTLPKGKSFERYDLGDVRICDMSLPGERAAALAIIGHIIEQADAGDTQVYFDKRITEDLDGMAEGSILFDGRHLKDGEEKVLAFVSVAYVPPLDKFYAAAHELTRRTLQRSISELYAGILRRHLAVGDTGAMTIKGEIPLDPADILTPSTKSTARDPYLWALLGVAGLRIRQSVKISPRDLRLVLISESYAKQSAFRALEEAGLFLRALNEVRAMLAKVCANPEFMVRVIDAVKAVAPKSHTDEINEDFIRAWAASESVARIIADRGVAVVKVKAASTMSEAEIAATAVLFGD